MRIPELLAPARDTDAGIAAIQAGADAVYIGPSFFGARKAAGNPVKDIARLIRFAHPYHVKVYATVNTVIKEEELEKARQLIVTLYNEGIDAIIFQDLALLAMDLPPVALFASTQTHNYDYERIQWLSRFGVSRFILARELDLQQIKLIKKSTDAELESFIHGALCVGYSGRCYFSKAITGRSGNRGECAQPCRSYYTLSDESGKILAKNKHLLSLKDLNLTKHLYALYEAGVTSFKIEGRLKDIHYVKNTVGWYRKHMDAVFSERGIRSKPSSGNVVLNFEPDPEKVFNRGFTDYFINGKRRENTNPDTQKSTGKKLGKVIAIGKGSIRLDGKELPAAGDGICFYGKDGKLGGTRVEKCEGRNIFLASTEGLFEGCELYRNYDHRFAAELNAPDSAIRKIPVSLLLEKTNNLLSLTAIDNEGHSISVETPFDADYAKDERWEDVIRRQLQKSGNTIYTISSVKINLEAAYFFRASLLNELRRRCLEALTAERIMKRAVYKRQPVSDPPPLPFQPKEDENISNHFAAAIFQSAAISLPPQLELQQNLSGKIILRTRFCLRHEQGICPGKNATPLFMKDNKYSYRLEFDCEKCEMSMRLI